MNPISRLLIIVSSIDPDAQAWRAAVLANGGSVSVPTMRAVSNFCQQAKGLGLWSKLTRLNLVCGDQLAAAQVPLKVGGGSSTETLTSIVAADYAEQGSTAGIKGNGTTKFFDTGWNPVTQSASTSDFGLWAYVSGTEAGGTGRAIMGAQNTSSSYAILGWLSTGSAEQGGIAALSSSELSPAGPTSSKQGLLGITVSGSRSQQFYQNGAASGSPVTASGTYISLPIFVLASNRSGTVTLFSTRYMRAYAITTGMSATDAANLYALMQTFQTALNRNV